MASGSEGTGEWCAVIHSTGDVGQVLARARVTPGLRRRTQLGILPGHGGDRIERMPLEAESPRCGIRGNHTMHTNIIARLRQGRFPSVCHPEPVEGSLPSKQLLPGWLVTNRVKPAGNELRVLSHKPKRSEDAALSYSTQLHQIRSVIVDGREPVIDDKRLKQIGYQLELKCRDVEF